MYSTGSKKCEGFDTPEKLRRTEIWRIRDQTRGRWCGFKQAHQEI